MAKIKTMLGTADLKILHLFFRAKLGSEFPAIPAYSGWPLASEHRIGNNRGYIQQDTRE